MKSYPVLMMLVLSLVLFSCRETFGEQHKDIHNQNKLPSQKNGKASDSLPGYKDENPIKSKPSRKKTKARDTLKPKIAGLETLN